MRLADAWALLPGLGVLERDPAREEARLAALACWAGNYTPEISLSRPGTLLLEVEGSLRLFGGLAPLCSLITEGIAGQGHRAVSALAPTPRAAFWLAGNDPARGAHNRYPTLPEMQEAMARLPLAALELPPAAEARLAGFGVRIVGDLLRLPRAGLARRFGPEFTTELAQAMGELPEPLLRHVFPERFREQLELPARVEDAGRLCFAAQRLIAGLCGWLAARASGVVECRLQLHHEHRATTSLPLRFGSPTRDPVRIGRILRECLEKLGRQGLAAAVSVIELQADAVVPMPGRGRTLFGTDGHGQADAEGVMQLVERLRARLGDDEVHGLGTVSEHRPECASRKQPPGVDADPAGGIGAPRPCWLLAEPQRLPEIAGRPQRGGPLALLAGPERIESGWWDAGEAEAAGDVRRDYFVAMSAHQEYLWIFRSDAGWFLHGLFA